MWLLVLKIIPDVAFAPTLVEILRSAFVKRGFQLLTLADVTLLHADSGHAPLSLTLYGGVRGSPQYLVISSGGGPPNTP